MGCDECAYACACANIFICVTDGVERFQKMWAGCQWQGRIFDNGQWQAGELGSTNRGQKIIWLAGGTHQRYRKAYTHQQWRRYNFLLYRSRYIYIDLARAHDHTHTIYTTCTARASASIILIDESASRSYSCSASGYCQYFVRRSRPLNSNGKFIFVIYIGRAWYGHFSHGHGHISACAYACIPRTYINLLCWSWFYLLQYSLKRSGVYALTTMHLHWVAKIVWIDSGIRDRYRNSFRRLFNFSRSYAWPRGHFKWINKWSHEWVRVE